MILTLLPATLTPFFFFSLPRWAGCGALTLQAFLSTLKPPKHKTRQKRKKRKEKEKEKNKESKFRRQIPVGYLLTCFLPASLLVSIFFF
jgi:hypothetical protein